MQTPQIVFNANVCITGETKQYLFISTVVRNKVFSSGSGNKLKTIFMATYPVVAWGTVIQGRFRCYVNGITVFFLIITDDKDVNITDVFLIDHLEQTNIWDQLLIMLIFSSNCIA